MIEEPDIDDITSLFPSFPYMQSFSNNMSVLNPRNSMIFPVDSIDTNFQNNCGSYEQAGSTNFVF